MIGDFNAHSPIWDIYGRSNNTGKNIEYIIEHLNLGILNDINSPTYINNFTGKTSCLDLCITAQVLSNKANFTRGQDLGSDHFPIEITIGVSTNKTNLESNKKWKLEKADWKGWIGELDKCENCQYILPLDPNAHNKLLTDRILEVSDVFIPKSSGKKSTKRCTPWWDDECREVVRNRNSAKHLLLQHPTRQNLLNFKKLQATVKVITRKKKRNAWKDFASTLTSNTPSAKVWRTIRAINGTPPIFNIPIGDVFSSNSDKANMLVDHFSRYQTQNDVPRRASSIDLTNTEINPISNSEVVKCIKKLKNTSPGPDSLCNSFLKHAPPNIICEISYLFNSSLFSGSVPQDWKDGIICSFPKPGKDPSVVSSYRPISMLSCMGKLMERVLKQRLEYHFETHKIFPPTQSGFRKCRSTIDTLAILKHLITLNRKQKNVCIVVYLDLDSAYDCVWHEGLLYRLKEIGINDYILRWLTDYLSNRSVRVRVGKELSEKRVLTKGLPQGAVLSPILFNAMLSDIPRSDNVKVLSYADDITLCCSAKTAEEASTNMQLYLDTLTSWLDMWKFNVNPNKCAYQVYTGKRSIPQINLSILNGNIANKETQRVLGVIFDAPRLSLNAHIKTIKDDCVGRLCILRSISSNRWGASRNLLRRVYISFIRSKLEYGSIVFDELTKGQLQKLNMIQNGALRTILGARKTSPIMSLEIESYILPIDLRFKLLFIKWFSKIMYSPINMGSGEISQEMGIIPCHDNNCFTVQAKSIFSDIGLPITKRVPTPYVSPVSPEIDLLSSIHMEMMDGERYVSDNRTKLAMFSEVKALKFGNHIEIYTDGSKLDDGSTSAGIYVPSLKVATSFKLNPQHTVLGSELFGLHKALEFIENNSHLSHRHFVILTDSLSALYIVGNTTNPSYRNITYKIQNQLLNLRHRVEFQWVRGHIGIEGNEAADRAANQGHNNIFSTLSSLSYDEVLIQIKAYFYDYWIKQWKDKVQSTQKGRFLSNHLEKPKYRLWLGMKSRLQETVSSRLRIGHVGVNNHLYRFEMSESDRCDYCGQCDTIEHFLTQCVEFGDIRADLHHALRQLEVPFTMTNILLGGEFEEKVQMKIHKVVMNYVAINVWKNFQIVICI